MTKPEEQEFAALVLHGRRFEHHSVPLEVLRELEAYERLILEVAKAMFLTKHPERQRVPKGFESRFSLSLRQVEEGSAMPVLLRSVASKSGQTTLLPPVADEFEQARDMIAAAVEAAGKGAAVSREFPRSMLGRFNVFGRCLRPTEAIELRRRRNEPGPRYNHVVRKRLVLMEEKSFSDTVDLVGRIYEADVERGIFHVLADAQKVPGSFTTEHEDILLVALKDHDHTTVRLVGTGRYDAQDQLERIDELTDVSFVDEGQLTAGDLEQRVDELAELGKGWLDGDGEPLDPEGLKKLSGVLLELHQQEDVPVPYVYPRPEGGVQAEWTIGTWELSATIDLASGDANLDAVDIDTGADTEAKADLHSPKGRLAFVQFVSSFQRKVRP